MGMTFIADGAPEVSMSYIVLSRIRDAIAMGADKDFGFFYERDVDIPRIVMNRVDGDILCFLMQPDVRGKLGYAACGKVAVELEKYRVPAASVASKVDMVAAGMFFALNVIGNATGGILFWRWKHWNEK